MRMFGLLILFAAACWAEGAFGTWKMNPARSTFIGGPHPESLTVRIEPHAKGEVLTLDKTGGDGRATTFSTILYLDGKARDFQDTSVWAPNRRGEWISGPWRFFATATALSRPASSSDWPRSRMS